MYQNIERVVSKSLSLINKNHKTFSTTTHYYSFLKHYTWSWILFYYKVRIQFFSEHYACSESMRAMIVHKTHKIDLNKLKFKYYSYYPVPIIGQFLYTLPIKLLTLTKARLLVTNLLISF